MSCKSFGYLALLLLSLDVLTSKSAFCLAVRQLPSLSSVCLRDIRINN